MGNQGRKSDFSNNNSQGWRSNQNQNFGWKQEHGSSNEQGPFQQQQQPNYPSIPKRMNKLEDTLEKFMKAIKASHQNNMATIKNMEIQMGQMAKQITERQSGQFSVNVQTNPKEH